MAKKIGNSLSPHNYHWNETMKPGTAIYTHIWKNENKRLFKVPVATNFSLAGIRLYIVYAICGELIICMTDSRLAFKKMEIWQHEADAREIPLTVW